MRILIVGAGVVGSNLAQQLTVEGHEISIIDLRKGVVDGVGDSEDVFPVCGEGTSPSVLEEAGIKDAELLIAVTDSDHRNLIICLLADRYGVKTKIARVRQPDFTGEIADFLTQRLGIARLIHPEEEVVRTLLQFIDTPGTHEVADFADGEILFRGFEIAPSSRLCNLRLMDIRAQFPNPRFLIVALHRGEELLIPMGTTQLSAGDLISVVIARDHIEAFLRLIGLTPNRRPRVLVAFASAAAISLAQKFEARGNPCVLIEPNTELCKTVAGELEGTEVVNGNPISLSDLRHAGVSGADVFIALGTVDETNLMASLLARKAGVPMVIYETNTAETAHILDSLGLHCSVDPRLLTVAAILRDVRRGRVLSMAKFGKGDAEAIEFEVLEDCHLVGKPLARLQLPKGSLLGAIGREGRVEIPDGATELRPGDRALVFSLPEAVEAICKLFDSKKREGFLGFLGL